MSTPGPGQWERTRRHARVAVSLPASDPARAGAGYFIRDISGGGLGVRIPSPAGALPPPRAGTPVVFAVELQSGRIEIPGEVVWTLPPARNGEAGLGVRFAVLSDSERIVVDVLSRLQKPARLSLAFFPEGRA